MALALLVPRSAGALGFGYDYSLNQAEFKPGKFLGGERSGPLSKLEFPVHRITFIDTSGALATIIASARYDRDVESGMFSTTTTETFYSEYTPMQSGIRVELAYAWSDAEVDSQIAGEPVQKSTVDYDEFQFTVGGLVGVAPWYVDFDMIDMAWVGMTGPARIDSFIWRLNFEAGALFPPFRAGLLTEFDLTSGVDSIFDGYPFAWAWGVGLHFDLPVVGVHAVWRDYTMSVDDHGGVAEGRSLTFGGRVEFF